jgi:hypothetical protein
MQSFSSNDSDDSSGESTPRASIELEGYDVVDADGNVGMRVDSEFYELKDNSEHSYVPRRMNEGVANIVDVGKENQLLVAQPPRSAPLSTQNQQIFYPDLRSDQTHYPINLPAHSPLLRSLDRNFYRPTITIHDQNQQLALPSTNTITDSKLESRHEKEGKLELKRQEEFINARFPYISLASRRLQAGMGVRNETVFELPASLPNYRSPQMGVGVSPDMRRVLSTEGLVGGGSGSGRGGLKRGRSEGNLISQYNMRFGESKVVNTMGRVVDQATGRGLREYLLQMGKEYGMQIRRCESMVLVNETPDMKNGAPRGLEVLREFGGEWRIEVRVGEL